AASAGPARASATFDFFKLNLRDGTSQALPWAQGAGYVTDLAPDGTDVLYLNGGKLTIAGIDGSNARPIAVVPHQILAAAWSPDGRTIAFELADTTACGAVPPPCAR